VCTYNPICYDLGGLSLLFRTLDKLRATSSFDLSIEQHVSRPTLVLPPVPGDDQPDTYRVDPTLRVNPLPDKVPLVEPASCVALYHRTPAPALRYIVDIPPLPLPKTLTVPEPELRLLLTMSYYAKELFIDLVSPQCAHPSSSPTDDDIADRDRIVASLMRDMEALVPLSAPKTIWKVIKEEEAAMKKRDDGERESKRIKPDISKT
jgi:hypothetical protein